MARKLPDNGAGESENRAANRSGENTFARFGFPSFFVEFNFNSTKNEAEFFSSACAVSFFVDFHLISQTRNLRGLRKMSLRIESARNTFPIWDSLHFLWDSVGFHKK